MSKNVICLFPATTSITSFATDVVFRYFLSPGSLVLKERATGREIGIFSILTSILFDVFPNIADEPRHRIHQYDFTYCPSCRGVVKCSQAWPVVWKMKYLDALVHSTSKHRSLDGGKHAVCRPPHSLFGERERARSTESTIIL